MMACHDPFCDDERIEVRWLRPGGVVAESYSLTLCSPKEVVDALERLYNTLAEWKKKGNGRNYHGPDNYHRPDRNAEEILR